MPSRSVAQHNLMEMAAHDPAAAKRTGVPQSVAKEFVAQDTAHSIAHLPVQAPKKPRVRVKRRRAGP